MILTSDYSLLTTYHKNTYNQGDVFGHLGGRFGSSGGSFGIIFRRLGGRFGLLWGSWGAP